MNACGFAVRGVHLCWGALALESYSDVFLAQRAPF